MEGDATAVFHAHLDRCERCRTQPFNLCAIGAELLRTAVPEPAPESERFLCPRCGEYHEDEARCSNCGRHS